MSGVDDLIERLAASTAGSRQLVLDLVLEEPETLPELVVAAAARLTTHASRDIDAVFGLLPDSALPGVADAAVSSLQAGADPDDSQAAILVAQLGMQAPVTLQRHLEELWLLRPNGGSDFEFWPWRGARRPDDVHELSVRLHDANPEVCQRALVSLLEARTNDAWESVREALDAQLPMGWRAQAVLSALGIDGRDGLERRRFLEPVCHVQFPAGYLVDPVWTGVEGTLTDPSWHPGTEVVGRALFGGASEAMCNVCHQHLHRVLRIDAGPGSALGGREIVTCLRCLCWSAEVLFFSHRDGVTRPAGPPLQASTPEFPADPLPEVRVDLVRTPDRWRLQDWLISNGEQNLTRVGGEPTWIQFPAYPTCPGCGASMGFLLQVDSLDIAQGGWLWGSGGILLVFWCDRCAMSATTVQCT